MYTDERGLKCTQTGTFFNGKLRGEGVLKKLSPDKGVEVFSYSGNWNEGLFDGPGELKDDTAPKFADCFTYVGEFFQGMYHGNGTIKYNNKNKYEGAWLWGKYDGPGFLTLCTIVKNDE